MYSTKYIYDNPSNAGPFKGRSETVDKYSKGDYIGAVFGAATIISSVKIKPPLTRTYQEVCDTNLMRR